MSRTRKAEAIATSLAFCISAGLLLCVFALLVGFAIRAFMWTVTV